jgi:Flp pilus assembly pilin Flp
VGQSAGDDSGTTADAGDPHTGWETGTRKKTPAACPRSVSDLAPETPAATLQQTRKEAPTMKTTLKQFLNDEAGLETVEYAIISGLIVAGLVAIVTAIGAWVNGQFTTLQTDLGA